MSRLPLLISVPHAGLDIPVEVATLNQLPAQQIVRDGDEGAAEIYAVLRERVAYFVTTPIARAFLDLNRAQDDIRKDGVVKTHTCWGIPIYRTPLTPDLIESLLAKYHRPYHKRLSNLANKGVILGIDCHTMAQTGPPVGPDPGLRRPLVCLGNAHNATCPADWIESLAECFSTEFFNDVSINEPFAGGYITRCHGEEMLWIQLELSRDPMINDGEKAKRILQALTRWYKMVGRVKASL